MSNKGASALAGCVNFGLDGEEIIGTPRRRILTAKKLRVRITKTK